MANTVTTYHKTREEAEKAKERFEDRYGGFPYEGTASVYPRSEKDPQTLWVCEGRHYGSG